MSVSRSELVRVSVGRLNAQLALLAPAWSSALARAGLAAGEVDLYVQRSREPNAFAAGGRSVAVTTGVLAKFQARRLGEEYLVAILTHELGHHATRATKFALVTMWLALPWRFASRLVIGIGLATVGRRQPLRLLGVVVLAGVVVAVVQAVQQRQWAVAAVLSAVAVCAVVCPLVDAAVSRRSEYAADRYAAGVGVGRSWRRALQVLDGGQRGAPAAGGSDAQSPSRGGPSDRGPGGAPDGAALPF